MEELEELYIKDVAKRKSVDIAKATALIDRCIKLVSSRLKVPYADVYSAIHDQAFMEGCLKGKCSDLDLDRCRESCKCIEFDGKCYARKFEDADKMNEDPDRYVMGMPTDKLAELVKIAAYLYHNFDGGGITDNTFDALEYNLNKRLKTKGRRYEKIGAPPVDKIRTKLPYPMPSLDKAKPGTRLLFDFLNEGAKGIVWSLKLDGVSAMVVYNSGEVSKIYTRGDGTIGGDVTFMKEYITLPTIDSEVYGDIVVRGEFILTRKQWEKYEGSYSNARSFVSSKVNSGSITQGLQDINFIAYEIIDLPGAEVPKSSTAMEILDSLGFNVVEHGSIVNPLVFDIMTLYREKRNTAEYYIDGLVLSIDVKAGDVPTKAVNPKNTIAFKMRLEEQIRHSKILNVEWNISRYGRLVPVASYESVYVDGVRLHRASAYNASHVRDWSLGKGSKIKVVRSGDVIPTIIDVEVDENITPIYPPTILPYGPWHWRGVDILLDEVDSNRAVQIKRIEHFFTVIGVPRLREKTIEKLWDAGFKTIRAITNAKPADLIKIKGIGKKTADAHYHNIHNTLRKTRIDRFIPASSTLELGIGRKLIKQVMRYHPTLLEEDEEAIKRSLTRKAIPGIGAKRIDNIAKNIPKFREFLFDLSKEDIVYAIDHDRKQQDMVKTRGYNMKVRGKTFVLTGFFGKVDYELEDYIYDNFGNFSSTVTSGTEAVITANLMETSSKMMTAQKLGVSVLSIEEFVERYDVPYSKAKDEGEEIEIPLDVEVDED
jgi:DNA ligase (NAD+)